MESRTRDAYATGFDRGRPAAAPAISIDCRLSSGEGGLAVKCLSGHVRAAMEADREQCLLWSGTIIAVRLAAGFRRGSFRSGGSRKARPR